jgi:hypothetical protein
MPYSQYRAELMGRAQLTPSGPFEAGSMQSFTLVYTAGAFGIDDTGSLKIGFRFATDFGPVQFSKPNAAGYTTVEASNGAELECKWEFKRNIRPWSRSLYIGIATHFLAPDDTITIRFGDRRFGSPGIRVQTYCESEFEFRVLVDPIATYDYVALPESPKIAIVPGPGVAMQAVMPTLRRVGDLFSLSIKAIDKWGNPSDAMHAQFHLTSSHPIHGLPEVVHLEKGQFAATITDLRADEPGDIIVTTRDDAGNVVCQSNPLRVTSYGERRHYWGDIHGQSAETLGTNSAQEYFEFGRDKAFLDIMSHQGNDFQITGAFWRQLNELTKSFDMPGRFVCFPGYEWSANTAVGGDRNVIYRNEGETIHRSSHAQIETPADMTDESADAHDARMLFEKLRGKDCVVMAHVGGRYADIKLAHDPMETAVEVHSAWGTFEWILQDALRQGYRMGVVANSDGHKGRPGACYPGASFFGSYGGLTCYLADRLDRDAIFESMRRRRHYATTGNRSYISIIGRPGKRAHVFERDPAHGASRHESSEILEMGDIARVHQDAIEFEIEIIGTAPIEKVEIYDGLDLLEAVRPYELHNAESRLRLIYEGAECRGRARATTWDGRLTIEGNSIVKSSMINNWNIDRGIQSVDGHELTWKAVTTGNFGAIDLWLETPSEGYLAFETAHVSGRVAVADLCARPRVFDAGGLGRNVQLQRLPETMTTRHVVLRRQIFIHDRADTRLFIRLQQEDGHRAWTSPIYMFRGN